MLNHILIFSHIDCKNRSADFSKTEKDMYVIVSCKKYNFTCNCLELITTAEVNELFVKIGRAHDWTPDTDQSRYES